MKRIPHAQSVTRAIRAVRIATKKALKGLNQTAARRMARGDYPTAEALAAQGREIRQFESEVDALRKRWRDVCGAGAGLAKNGTTTLLWQYFQPILQALVQTGGACRRTDLEAHVERLVETSLLPGDRVMMARGRERWRVMVRRAHKPLVAEGWIEDKVGPTWRITEAGRRAADRPVRQGRGSG